MDAKRNPHLVIEATGLTRVYAMGETDVHALNGVDLQVRHSEFVAFMGASGSGKSTLLHLLGCLDRPSAGEYRLEGEEVSRLTADQRAHVRNVRIGIHLSNVQPAPQCHRIGKRGSPTSLSEGARAISSSVAGLCWPNWVSSRGRDTYPTNFRVGSASGWRSPALWSPTLRWSWPMSRPATWIALREARSCSCSPVCTSAAARSCWSRTMSR
jgi:energy-coupling factor transporter ATP-binding protein EcfA2